MRTAVLRRTRCFGLRKTGLQHLFTALAINRARMGAHLVGKEAARTRVSRFAALTPVA